MFKKWFASKSGASTKDSVDTQGMYRPYTEGHINTLYNLLFCDDLSLFRQHTSDARQALWDTLLAEQPAKASLTQIAEDASHEGRIRTVAYNRLRAAGYPVPSKLLFGVIVEVALKQGLDVLAAFSDGGVRYFNQSEKLAVFEGQGNPLEAQGKDLLKSCQPVVEKIGAWEKQRLPPPQIGHVRLTFLVSDGLYFGEGPFNLLQRDAMAGPVIVKASTLLQQMVAIAAERDSH